MSKVIAAPVVITPKTAEVKTMSPAQAAEYFSLALAALDYMTRGAQNAVNSDFDAEIPARQAGKDVDGRELSGSLKTRGGWTKLRRSLEKAHTLAQAVASAQASASK